MHPARPHCQQWTGYTPCTFTFTADGRKGYTLHVHTAGGYTLHAHTAGCGNGYTLLLAVERGYPLPVNTAGGGKGYALQVITAGCGNQILYSEVVTDSPCALSLAVKRKEYMHYVHTAEAVQHEQRRNLSIFKPLVALVMR